jgi:RNase H-fold protein (predicted Holliday junction resolvase)
MKFRPRRRIAFDFGAERCGAAAAATPPATIPMRSRPALASKALLIVALAFVSMRRLARR